jgi:hypothetical protein
MYSFTIKENGADTNVVVTRSLLALAGIASLLYHGHGYYIVNTLAAILLFGAALLTGRLMFRYKIATLSLLLMAAVLVLAATLFIPFALLLILYGLMSKKIYRNPVVNITSAGVHITKAFVDETHPWTAFNNIILKDDLLTLDFINNKLLQLTVVSSNHPMDEYSFNTFCSEYIGI